MLVSNVWIVVAAIASSRRSVVYSTCSPPQPIVLPVSDIGLSNGFSMRGIPGSVGTPPQAMSFMIQSFLNDTWIYNATDGFCYDDNPAFCTTYRGGLYDTSSSSTFQSASDVGAAGANIQDMQSEIGSSVTTGAWATDELSIGNISLANYPIGMPGYSWNGPYSSQNVLGLGRNSTLLTALLTAGQIASRSYSWWWGQPSTPQMNGSLILGGYDVAKTTGPSLASTIDTPTVQCPSGLSLTIQKLVIDAGNGEEYDILEGDSFNACLSPNNPPLMTLPGGSWQDFEYYGDLTVPDGLGGGQGIQYQGVLFPVGSQYQGDVTLQLQASQTAINITIPNDILVVTPQRILPDGSIYSNRSETLLTIDPMNDPDDDGWVILGRPFFSAAYLNVDLDAQAFTIWAASATNETDIVAQGTQCVNTTSSLPITTTASTTVASASASKDPTRKTSTISHGAIAGAVVGSACGAAAMAASAIILVLRYRDRKRRLPSHDSSMSLAPHQMGPNDGGQSDPAVKEQGNIPTQEMDNKPDPHELEGMESPRLEKLKEGVAENKRNLPLAEPAIEMA